jgi:hypothetical protein
MTEQRHKFVIAFRLGTNRSTSARMPMRRLSRLAINVPHFQTEIDGVFMSFQ